MIARSRLVANFLSHCAMYRQLTRVIGLNQSVRLQSTNDNPDENITLKLPPNATGISVEHSNEKSLDGTSLRSNKSAPESEQCYKQLQNLKISKNEILRELKVEVNMHTDYVQSQYEIFVGGLSEEISQDALRTYFSQFGEVVKCSLFGESGYVTFKSSLDRDHVLDARPFYIIGNRITNAELILWRQKFRREDYGLRELKVMANPADDRTILVNGLSAEISKDALLAYLSRFGDVELCQIPSGDQSAYVTFKSPIAVRLAINTSLPHYIIADRITNKIPMERKEDDETLQKSDPSKTFSRGVEFIQSKTAYGGFVSANSRPSAARTVALSEPTRGLRPLERWLCQCQLVTE
ncbi:RNA recognition motif domain-containing protein [Ditylenchus destructor]|nr:RNA recognition motif domain-containing protein [Ditylenchus destructor]